MSTVPFIAHISQMTECERFLAHFLVTMLNYGLQCTQGTPPELRASSAESNSSKSPVPNSEQSGW